MRRITKHIIHCSDSSFGDVEILREWHVERGFRDIGYHFIIKRDGVIELGRPIHEIGAHCKGFNTNSIGTCLIGKNHFEELQFKALRKLHSMLQNMFEGITHHPHCFFNAHKTCPNFNVDDVLE